MKKLVISLAALALASSVALAGPKQDGHQGPTGAGEGVLDCSGAVALSCGDGAVGSIAGGGTVASYACTGLSYDGAEEAVYEVCVGGDGEVTVDVLYAHDDASNDLDLFLLGSCDPSDCIDASLDVSGVESVTAFLPAGTYYAVVDGWEGLANGSDHEISVSCDSPCATPTLERTWGAIKSVYSAN